MSRREDVTRTHRFFGRPQGASWRWDAAEAEVVGTREGTLLAFHQEVHQLLRQLHGDAPLPRFDLLLLFLVATRAEARKTLRLEFDATDTDLAGLPLLDELSNHGRFPARGRIARYLFPRIAHLSDLPGSSRSDSATLLRVLDAGIPAEEFGRGIETLRMPIGMGLRLLGEGLQDLDAASLRRLAETGLVDPPQPAAIELQDPPPGAGLLAELDSHERFQGLVALARRTQAAVALPRPLQIEDDRAAGGVGGITNRGALDRLLISEFANDDDLFLLRLAQGEALYREPEIARQDAPRCVHLLLDHGIRAWGRPRLFGLATALGLLDRHHGDADIDLRCWTADGPQLTEHDLVDPSRRASQLDRLLDHTTTDLHTGAAFTTLAEQAATTDDLVVILPRTAAADREFRSQLAATARRRILLITLTAEGQLEMLHSDGHGGFQRGCRAVLPTELLEPQRRPAPARRPRQTQYPDPELPLPSALQLEVFPLRMPHRNGPSASSPQRGHAWIDRVGRFWITTTPDHGGRQLPGRIEGARRLAWIGDGELLVDRGDLPQQRLLLGPRNDPGHDASGPASFQILEREPTPFPNVERRPPRRDGWAGRPLCGKVQAFAELDGELVYIRDGNRPVLLGKYLWSLEGRSDTGPYYDRWTVLHHLGGRDRPYPCTRPDAGGALWFDRRGLLYLIPADPKLAELCVTLPPPNHGAQIAGWSSVGECFGDPWFHDPGAVVSSETELRRRIAEILTTFR